MTDHTMTADEQKLVEILSDPVKWSKYELGMELRPYQAHVLQSQSKRIVMRMARRLGKTTVIALHMLWYAYTHKDARCLYVAPLESQTSELYEEVLKLMQKSDAVWGSVVEKTKDPQFIKFGNGSIIKMKTAGTKSGSQGFSLRGQPADWLYVDEMDYLEEADWTAIWGIVLEDPQRIGVMVASTPTGKRGTFYKLCVAPDTLVTTSDGMLRKISDIKTGDRVITHCGTAEPVTEVMKRHYTGDMVRIQVGGPRLPILCTPEHPFYVCRFGEYKWVEAKDILPTDEMLIPLPQFTIESDYTEDEAELLGYMQASISVKTDDMLRKVIKFKPYNYCHKRILQLLKNVFGPQYYEETDELHVMSDDIYEWYEANKTIPSEITYGDINIVKAFIKGYLRAKGHFSGDLYSVLATTEQLGPIMTMLIRLGVIPNCDTTLYDTTYCLRIGKYYLSDQLRDCVRFRDDWRAPARTSTYIQDGYVHLNIVSIDTIDYNGDVYNLEVSNAHTYTANMIAVHNCTDKALNWEEIHYTIMDHPNWNAAMEYEMHMAFPTEAAWEHEALAEFGNEIAGVFNKTFLDEAQADYDYIEYTMPQSLVTIGVDWDKYGAETQIVVLAYDQAIDKFRVINRKVIPRGEFTLDNGVQTIIRLNEIYNPLAIYVDRGYGEYQVETLHKYGIDHPETGLAQKVVGIAFSEKIDVPDPFTHKVTRKPIKPFMVDQVAIQLERRRLVLNKHDTALRDDLMNYSIKRYTSDGAPVFTSISEHTVDALMLALLAFTQQMPNITNTLQPISVARSADIIKLQQRDPLAGLFHSEGRQQESMHAVPVGSRPQRHSYNQFGRGRNTVISRKQF